MDNEVEPDAGLTGFHRQVSRNRNLRALAGDNFERIKESLRDKGPKKSRRSPSSSGRGGSDEQPLFEPA